MPGSQDMLGPPNFSVFKESAIVFIDYGTFPCRRTDCEFFTIILKTPVPDFLSNKGLIILVTPSTTQQEDSIPGAGIDN